MIKKNKILKESVIADVIEKYPEVIEIMSVDYGLGCVGCMAASGETIEEGAEVHGLTKADIEKMISEMNKKILE